jgi:hypothetical protein
MPRYFFDLKNGHRLVDPAGIDRASDDAKQQAKVIASQIARDVPASTIMRKVAVIDEDGREITAIKR